MYNSEFYKKKKKNLKYYKKKKWYLTISDLRRHATGKHKRLCNSTLFNEGKLATLSDISELTMSEAYKVCPGLQKQNV